MMAVPWDSFNEGFIYFHSLRELIKKLYNFRLTVKINKACDINKACTEINNKYVPID